MGKDTALEKLTEEYYASFPEKKEELQAAFQLILKNNWNKESLIGLKFLSHKLSGSTGLYGFTKLSSLIHSMEKAIDCFKQSDAEKEAIRKILSAVVDQFDSEISNK